MDTYNPKDIDPQALPMVEFFNLIGLTTKYSCQGGEGHGFDNFEIMFDDDVQEEKIINLLKHFSNERGNTVMKGTFLKYTRFLNGKIKRNWIYQCEGHQAANEELCLFKAFSTIKKTKE